MEIPSLVQPASHCSATWWLEYARKVLQRDCLRNRDFIAHFGVSPFIASVVWCELCERGGVPAAMQHKHLLWALCWLKVYATDTVMLSILNLKSEKTFKKYRDMALEDLYKLENIDLSRRFEGQNGSRCLMTVDGTDFMTFEPGVFDPKWYSEKFNGPGLRYEVGICIQTGYIVWVNGPFPCGSWSDGRISYECISSILEPWEFYIADKGYGGPFSITPSRNPLERKNDPYEKMMGKARARHETINRRLKEFGCLRNKWRHGLLLHYRTFRVCANLVQFKLEYEGLAFHVHYDDKPYLKYCPR